MQSNNTKTLPNLNDTWGTHPIHEKTLMVKFDYQSSVTLGQTNTVSRQSYVYKSLCEVRTATFWLRTDLGQPVGLNSIYWLRYMIIAVQLMHQIKRLDNKKLILY